MVCVDIQNTNLFCCICFFWNKRILWHAHSTPFHYIVVGYYYARHAKPYTRSLAHPIQQTMQRIFFIKNNSNKMPSEMKSNANTRRTLLEHRQKSNGNSYAKYLLKRSSNNNHNNDSSSQQQSHGMQDNNILAASRNMKINTNRKRTIQNSVCCFVFCLSLSRFSILPRSWPVWSILSVPAVPCVCVHHQRNEKSILQRQLTIVRRTNNGKMGNVSGIRPVFMRRYNISFVGCALWMRCVCALRTLEC